MRTFFLTLLIATLLISSGSIAFAQTPAPGEPISGWMWSDTIGWSNLMNVSVDQTGVLSGYAWSDNIGWISFNRSSGCPTGECVAKLSRGALSGWVRACAGSADGACGTISRKDGWDGWISLAGSNYGARVNSPSYSTFAWGGDVVGWVAFDIRMQVNTDVCPNIQGSQSSIPAGMILDSSGNCVAPTIVQPPPPPPPPVTTNTNNLPGGCAPNCGGGNLSGSPLPTPPSSTGQFNPSSATCYPTKNGNKVVLAKINDLIVWKVDVTDETQPPPRGYSYSWSGDASGVGPSVSMHYSQVGDKKVSVQVTGTSKSVSAACSVLRIINPVYEEF